MNLWSALRGRAPEARSLLDNFDPWPPQSFMFGGTTYPIFGQNGSASSEQNDTSFANYVENVYKASGAVSATILSRLMLFTEARFQWQQINKGRPGNLFGTPELAVLEKPWPNGTTGELLARAEQDVSLAGNFYVARERTRLRRLRPDWVSIILTAPPDEAVDSDVAGYLFRPGGLMSKATPVIYLPGEVAHWTPIPDPSAMYRGMSWLTPVLTEVLADQAATLHKAMFFKNGATPQMVVKFSEMVTKETFDGFVGQTNATHDGVRNAYKTLYLGGGADAQIVGLDLKQLDFAVTQGHGETRITAAGGVPAVVVGLSEGLQAATYSNYGQARRKFGDHWARPQWRSVCAAMEPLLKPPANAQPGTFRLWYDDRDIAFLREDAQDAANIVSTKASSIMMLVNSGYTPESAAAAVEAQDMSLLQHTGLYSVQLQPPTTTMSPDGTEPTPQPAVVDEAEPAEPATGGTP